MKQLANGPQGLEEDDSRVQIYTIPLEQGIPVWHFPLLPCLPRPSSSFHACHARNGLKKARMSSARVSGCSRAAK